MSKIISIHSYRGGTGKSNSTANLAASLACAGKRVGIVDTDLPSPGIHVLFGFDESKLNKTLNDFLWGRCPVKDAAYDVTSTLGKAATPESALYLIPASIRINDISKILREGYDVELLNDGFQDLLEHLKLDYLFVDTHQGLSEETLLSFVHGVKQLICYCNRVVHLINYYMYPCAYKLIEGLLFPGRAVYFPVLSYKLY